MAATPNYYLIAFFAVALGASFAKANELDAPSYKFGGFGTLGASHSSQSLGDYVIDGTLPTGAGRSNNLATGNDSRLGVQLMANFTPRTSAVVQVISEYQADGSYQPRLEWVNIKYEFNSDTYIRFGRIDLPTFLYSDSRKVGYSYPWIHPPTELYRQLTITSSDGMDAKYRFGIGEAENSIKIIYGQTTLNRPTSISTSEDMRGIFDTIEYGSATFRIGYQMRESSSFNLLTGVTGSRVQNSDLSAAASYDPGKWFAVTEWIQRRSTTQINALSLSAGLRIEKFTPYFSYSQSSPASFISGFPAPTANAILSAHRSQSTDSLGIRWDFMNSADFKLQYDLVKIGANSNGYLINVPAGTVLYGTSFNVISAVVDFVF
jgi:hypothetical protein